MWQSPRIPSHGYVAEPAGHLPSIEDRPAGQGRRFAPGTADPRPSPKEEPPDMNDVPAHPNRRRRLRLIIAGFGALALAVTGTVVATSAYAEADRTITSNQTGYHNGFFFSYWKDSGNVTMNLGAGGNYSYQW